MNWRKRLEADRERLVLMEAEGYGGTVEFAFLRLSVEVRWLVFPPLFRVAEWLARRAS